MLAQRASCVRSLYVVILLVSLLLGWLAFAAADPATHRLPDMQRKMQVWFGDGGGGYVASGCVPTVPATSLTLTAFPCEGYVKDVTTGELLYVGQASVAVGPLSGGNGTYWLGLRRDTAFNATGCTEQIGTSYVWCQSATRPAAQTGVLIVTQVTVAAGAISAVVDVAPRVFTQPLTVGATWTTGPESAWLFFPGAILTPNALVTIGGTVVNLGQGQIFGAGSSNVVFAPTAHQPTVVDWFGATNDGLADSSAAVNRAIAALPLRGHLHFGEGTYLITASLTAFTNTIATGIASKGVRVTCAGRDKTIIQFTPTGAATLFSFQGTNTSTRMDASSLEECALFGGGNQTKTFVSIGNVDAFRGRNILINNTAAAGAGDTTSIGLRIDKNPQASTFENFEINNASYPVSIGTIATAQIFDHLTFRNLLVLNVAENPPVHPLISVADGSQLQQISFYETVGVGGKGLFGWLGTTTATTDSSRGLLFQGGRYEDGGLSTAAITFDIEPHATAFPLTHLRIASMNIGVQGAGTAFKLRNIKAVTIEDVYTESNTVGGTLYDINASVDSILVLNETGTANVGTESWAGNMKKILGSGRENVTPPTPEPIKYYQAITANKGIQSQYWQVMGHRIYTSSHVLATAGTTLIPPTNTAILYEQVLIAFNANGGTAGGCTVALFADTADTTAIKLSGTSNCVGAIPGAGEVGVYRNAGDDSIKIHNLSGVTKTISVLVFYQVTGALP